MLLPPPPCLLHRRTDTAVAPTAGANTPACLLSHRALPSSPLCPSSPCSSTCSENHVLLSPNHSPQSFHAPRLTVLLDFPSPHQPSPPSCSESSWAFRGRQREGTALPPPRCQMTWIICFPLSASGLSSTPQPPPAAEGTGSWASLPHSRTPLVQ